MSVLTTKDWQGFKRYAEGCRLGHYQIKDLDQGIEVNVRAGRQGFTKRLLSCQVSCEDPDHVNCTDDKQKKELEDIVAFCDAQGYLKIEKAVPLEQFFV